MKIASELNKLITELSEELEKERELANKFRDQLVNTRHDLVQKDYIVQNQKKALEQTKVTLERYEKENRALRELVGLWI